MEKEEPNINDGDQDNFFPDKTRAEMETMWEVILNHPLIDRSSNFQACQKIFLSQYNNFFQIPQISHFLCLTRESLSIPQLSIYEMERMLSMPRASKQLANIMTCLLRLLL